MKDIFLYPDDGNKNIDRYLSYNQIKFDRTDLWNPTRDQFDFTIIPKQTNVAIIIDVHKFINIMQNDLTPIVNFCQNNSIIIHSDIDTGMYLVSFLNLFQELDSKIPKNSIICFIDVEIIIEHTLSNILLVGGFKFSYFFNGLIRITQGIDDKIDCEKDFLLTMKNPRLHKEILWNCLKKLNLLERGICIYHGQDLKNLSRENFPRLGKESFGLDIYKNWAGIKTDWHTAQEQHLSTDIYLKTWFEIVPESMHSGAHYATEKIIKPISSRTPFLLLSSPGFLKYLRSVGFKTFNSLIDESYDDELDLTQRTHMLVDQVNDIIQNGSESFYRAALPILDHNLNMLATIAGRYYYDNDRLIWTTLKQQDIV